MLSFENVVDFLISSFGVEAGLVLGTVVLLITCIGIISWKWKKIRNLPGVFHLMTWLFEKPIPHADPNYFTVGIAHLESDTGHQHEILIVEALKDFEGVQILKFDRTIFLSGGAK